MSETGSTAATRKPRKTQRGVVVSDKMDKTLTVKVERTFSHPMYEKRVRRSTKLYAHDEKNEGRVGDLVELMESRPMSKQKRWRLVRVLRRPES